MVDSTVMSQVVHQIRYRWSEPVDSTMPVKSRAAWDDFLREHVRAAGPEPGFTFVARGDVGILIRKAGESAHALLSRGLGARTALGLTGWTGWQPDTLQPLHWATLEPAVTRGLRSVRERATALPPERLAVLYAQLLGAAGEPYTVLGEDDPAAVVLAFGDLFGQTPAFATDEADDAGAHLPTAVFLRKEPAAGPARRRLIANGPVPDQGLLAFTGTVAAAYVTDGPDALARIRPARPPADLAEALQWAGTAQFAPGVLADLTRLTRLAPGLGQRLADPKAVHRVTAAATVAPAADLVHALDRDLPQAVAAPIFRVALRRALPVTGEPLLVDRLAALGPLAPHLITEHLPIELDRLTSVTARLLTADDRAEVLTDVTATLPVPEVLAWIEERTGDDPAAAHAGFRALCRRAPDMSRADVTALIRRGALAGCVHRIAGSPREAARQLADLLGALPDGSIGMDEAAGLAASGDPVLLHALDTAVDDDAVREALHWQIRVAYYRSHGLPEPLVPPAGDTPAESVAWWQRAIGRRRTN
jgi:hypothetical protein